MEVHKSDHGLVVIPSNHFPLGKPSHVAQLCLPGRLGNVVYVSTAVESKCSPVWVTVLESDILELPAFLLFVLGLGVE